MKRIAIVLLGVLILYRFLMPGQEQIEMTVDMKNADVPQFSVEPVFGGEAFSQSDLDKVSLISFVSIYCGHCHRQHEMMARQKLPATTYLVFIDKDNAEVKKWLDANKKDYYKEAFIANEAMLDGFSIYFTPVTFVVKDGKIVKRYNGYLDEKRLAQAEADIKGE